MKTTNGLKQGHFDVWLRVKPYQQATSNHLEMKNQYVTRGTSRNPSERDRSPQSRGMVHSRSKSPNTFHQNQVTTRTRQEAIELTKADYKGMTVQGNVIITEPSNPMSESNRIGKLKTSHTFKFPSIIEDNWTNKRVFETIVRPKVDNCLANGGSFTTLTYGISGSGKSHTIFGSNQNVDPGSLMLSAEYLFSQQSVGRLEFSLVEIYNEKVFDLLTPDLRVLSMIDVPLADRVVIPDITVKHAQNFEQFKSAVLKAHDKRIVCPNMHNMNSSRSHVVVEITVYSGDVPTCRFRFVDLAGSERVEIS